MKKACLCVLILVLLCTSAYSQVRKLKIINTTSCNVFVNVRYTDPSGSPICTVAGTSVLSAVIAGSTYTYSALASPGTPGYVSGMPSPYNRYLVAANVFSSDMTCPVSVVTVGEGSCGYPPMHNVTVRHPQTCVICSSVNARWTTDIAGLEATLLLY